MSGSHKEGLNRTLRRLPAGSRVRVLANELLETGNPPDSLEQEVAVILDLDSRATLSERLAAAEIAPLIPKERRADVEGGLIRILDGEPEPDSSLLHALWILSFFPFVTPFSPIIEQGRRNALRARAARSLGRMVCVGAVDALARGLHDSAGASRTWGCAKVRRESGRALIPVLYSLTPDHATLLELGTVPNLARALPGCDEALALAILFAFEQVAHGEALRAVEAAYHRAASESVRQEAARLLPILRQRRMEELAASCLLRAAERDDRLRPAFDDPAGWLRPSDRAA